MTQEPSQEVEAPKLEEESPTRAALSLGREGSLSWLIRTLVLKGRSDAQILAVARKAHPDKKIGGHYPSWYRSQMVRAGFEKSQVYPTKKSRRKS